MNGQTWIDNSRIGDGDLVVLIIVIAAPVIGLILGWLTQRRRRNQ